MTDSDSEVFELTLPELKQVAQNAATELLPQKSRVRYEGQYSKYKEWCAKKNAKISSENVVLAYFIELVAREVKSLWSIYSMLKSCIILHENLDISKYPKLISYLKRKTANHVPKKSKILEEVHINRFIAQAPDQEFLLMKVVLIIGVSGACRREEMYKMVLEDVECKNDIILIKIPTSKTNVSRSFAITKKEWVEIITKYLQIREKITKIKDQLLLKYERGKCLNLPVGINAIGSIPSRIATFLNLENPKDFTGHCFRRSSATLLVNRGGDLLSLKRHGAWKSSTVAEGYIGESLKRKIDVANMMTEETLSTSKRLPVPSDFPSYFETTNENTHLTSHVEAGVENPNLPSTSNVQANQLIPGLFSHVETSTININIYNNCVFKKDI